MFASAEHGDNTVETDRRNEDWSSLDSPIAKLILKAFRDSKWRWHVTFFLFFRSRSMETAHVWKSLKLSSFNFFSLCVCVCVCLCVVMEAGTSWTWNLSHLCFILSGSDWSKNKPVTFAGCFAGYFAGYFAGHFVGHFVGQHSSERTNWPSRLYPSKLLLRDWVVGLVLVATPHARFIGLVKIDP